jgi:hypothetical protein
MFPLASISLGRMRKRVEVAPLHRGVRSSGSIHITGVITNPFHFQTFLPALKIQQTTQKISFPLKPVPLHDI